MTADEFGVRPFETIVDCSADFRLREIGNAWSRRYYDGPFHLFEPPADRPALSLVFVQSRDRNTVADNPADLGGGPTDKYLIYEGLSRVAADAVLAGAGTIGHSVLFTITHPEMVALRRELGMPPHLAQIVVSNDGNFDLSARLLTTPDVPVFVLAGKGCLDRCGAVIRERPWITIVPLADGIGSAMRQLRQQHGIARISAVGGPKVAASLVAAGVVQDLYLTTSAIDGGEPGTPWHGADHPPRLLPIVQKRETAAPHPIIFEQFAVTDPKP